MPPAVNWTAPPQCLSRYAGLQQCQFGEVGYAIMQTSNPKTSANLIYGTAVGGCKDSVNFYAIVGHGGPWALTAKACTSLNTKVRAGGMPFLQTMCVFVSVLLNSQEYHFTADPHVHPRDQQRHERVPQHVHRLQRLHQPGAERPRHVRFCVMYDTPSMRPRPSTQKGGNLVSYKPFYSSHPARPTISACWTNPGTYTVYYDGYNNTAWLAAYPTSTGLAEYAIFDSSQAFYKGGQAWQVHGKKTIVAGNMGSLQPWMGS